MGGSPFITVNGRPVSVEEAHAIALMADGYDLRTSVAEKFAVLDCARDEGHEISQDAIQMELDVFRREMGLTRGIEIEKWMSKNGVDKDAVRQFCEVRAARRALEASVDRQEIEEAFEDLAEDMEVLFLQGIVLDDRNLAQDVADRLRSGELSFLAALDQYGDREAKASGGVFGDIARGDLEGALDTALNALDVGDIAGPIDEDGVWVIYYLADIDRPELEDMEAEIREMIVDEMLEETLERTVVLADEGG